MSNTRTRKVVDALFDSYLAIRTAKWGQAVYDPENLPQHSDGRKRSATVQSLLKAAPHADSATYLWLDFVYKLYQEEKAAQGNKDATLRQPAVGPIASHLFSLYAKTVRVGLGPESMLANTLQAVRCYAISQLQGGTSIPKQELDAAVKSLTSELTTARQNKNADPATLTTLEQQLAAAQFKYEAIVTAETSKFHETFFDKVIKQRDQRDLNEASFDDFCTNAKKGSRKTPNCTKLVKAKLTPKAEEKKETAANKGAAKASSSTSSSTSNASKAKSALASLSVTAKPQRVQPPAQPPAPRRSTRATRSPKS